MLLTKQEWILLILRQAPLDRIHIMKTLFLLWHRSGRNIKDFFKFEPYLYGPCSFEVYAELRYLEDSGFIIRPPHLTPQWVNYYLTEKGREKAEEAAKKAETEMPIIKDVVDEISHLSFYELLQKVYTEAPDFAVNSMFKEVAK